MKEGAQIPLLSPKVDAPCKKGNLKRVEGYCKGEDAKNPDAFFTFFLSWYKSIDCIVQIKFFEFYNF